LAGRNKKPDKSAKIARPEPNDMNVFKFSDAQIASGEARKMFEAIEAAGEANKLAQFAAANAAAAAKEHKLAQAAAANAAAAAKANKLAQAAAANASVNSSKGQSSADGITIDDSNPQNWLRREKSDSDDLSRLSMHETFTNMLGTFTSLTIAPPSPAAGEATSNSPQGHDNPVTVSNEGSPSLNSLPESLGVGWSFIQNHLLSTSSDDMASSIASTSPLRSLPSQPHTVRWLDDNYEPKTPPSRPDTDIERGSPLPDSWPWWASNEKNPKTYIY
jgi:hypothetical protein